MNGSESIWYKAKDMWINPAGFHKGKKNNSGRKSSSIQHQQTKNNRFFRILNFFHYPAAKKFIIITLTGSFDIEIPDKPRNNAGNSNQK
jgi:hypothetical protein